MYQALTRCIDKIEKQAVRMKKKIIERRQGATPLSALAPTPAKAQLAAETAEAAKATAPRIINARRYRVKPMTAEEAVLALSDDDNQFLVFRDADTDSLSVMYKRKDGTSASSRRDTPRPLRSRGLTVARKTGRGEMLVRLSRGFVIAVFSANPRGRAVKRVKADRPVTLKLIKLNVCLRKDDGGRGGACSGGTAASAV